MSVTKRVPRRLAAAAICLLSHGAIVVPARAQGERPPNGFALQEPSTPEAIAAARPNPQAPGFRVPLPPLDRMAPAMRAEFETTAKRLKMPVPPAAPFMLTPDIKAAMASVLGATERSGLPDDIHELTILMASRYWGSQVQWWVHAPQAVIAGVPAGAVEAIRLGRRPSLNGPGQAATYRYLVELLRDHAVTDAAYEDLRAIIGSEKLVALTVLAGHYGNVGMTGIAHRLPLRADVQPPLPRLRRAFP